MFVGVMLHLVRHILKQVADAFSIVGPPHRFGEHHRNVDDLKRNTGSPVVGEMGDKVPEYITLHNL